MRGFKKCSGGYQPKLFLDQTDTKDLLSRFIKDFKDYSNYTLSLVETELNNLIYKVTLNELAPFKHLRSSILEVGIENLLTIENEIRNIEPEDGHRNHHQSTHKRTCQGY